MTKRMKLSTWAKENGFSYRGAYEMFKRGDIPNAEQIKSGTILVTVDSSVDLDKQDKTIIYARVSSPKQKDDVQSQASRLEHFCNNNGWKVAKVFKEIASGLNDNRPLLIKILTKEKPTRLVVEHKDRLTRFGFNYIKIYADSIGCEIVVANDTTDDENDLMSDFVALITSMTARLYGLRRGQRKTDNIIKELNNND